MSIEKNFDEFLSNIDLPKKAILRIESARTALAAFLIASYGISPDDVFLQGSYANHTAIRPIDGGEYDVDIVCVAIAPRGVTSTDALNDLERRFRNNGNYAHRIVTKDPCVRLEYQEDDIGKFHVDVVPVRLSISKAPLDAPHRKRGWHETAPAEYTQWCTDQGELYARTVKMLKHWRNEQQPVREAIKSIVLQVLVAQCMPQIDDDAERVASTFDNLATMLNGHSAPPAVYNPVLPDENLTATWTEESFRNFKAEVTEAQELSRLAFNQPDPAQAAALWAMLFGDRFPSASPRDYGLKLGDQSHRESESSRRWTEHLDGQYSLTLSARVYRGYNSRHSRPYKNDDAPIFASEKIRFTARRYGPAGGQIWWQVVNTGGHARSEGGLRGEFSYATAAGSGGGRSSNPLVNWESSSYTGVHLIRPILVVDNNVVAKAAWMRVNIINPKRPFTL